MKSTENKAVILLSGGLDSTTTLAIAQKEGFDCFAMTFRYGQRHAREIDCACRVAVSHAGRRASQWSISIWVSWAAQP